MPTAYVHKINAFDAAAVYRITFGYDGPQCVKNKLTVYNSSTNASVYSDTLTSFNLSHDIPANTLTNGVSYYCTVTAYYMVNNVEQSVTSSQSNVFKCITTPNWDFVGLTDGSVVGNSYYTFQIDYSQLEGETVNEFYIVVYTASHSVFWSSGALYDITATPKVTGLQRGSYYYVRAYGTTTNGFGLDTRTGEPGTDIKVNVSYEAPALYSIAYLTNNRWQGSVKIQTNVTGVEGISDSDPVYINNSSIDLRNNKVTFSEGFTFSDVITLEAIVYDASVNVPILMLSDGQREAVITFRQGVFSDGEKFYVELRIPSQNYVIYSQRIAAPSAVDKLHLWIQVKNGLFTIKIAVLAN